jgi:hypothetical protein
MRADEAKRLATTESLFRDVNERIAESVQRSAQDEAAFVCECSDASCTHRVEAALDDYEDVRARPTLFLVVPGHEDERIEHDVGEAGSANVVEKRDGEVAATVRRLDPRGD